MVEGVGRLAKTQLRLDVAIRVREKCPAGPEPGAQRGVDLGWIDADRDNSRVGDLRVILQHEEPSEERLFLGAPPTSEELHDRRVPANKR
jgi:hypothetical protein